ncbi:MAG: FixH family protein [Hyphomonadaceae bacterium]
MATRAMKTKGLRGIHVLWWISGFFAVIIALDTLFVTWALQSFPGEEVKNSYVLGLDYNREVERRREQEKLGWTSEVGLEQADDTRLVVRMNGADQAPVTGLAVSASVHVIGEADATTIDLAEGAPGEYTASLAAPSQARLELSISARRHGEEQPVFTAIKSLVSP